MPKACGPFTRQMLSKWLTADPPPDGCQTRRIAVRAQYIVLFHCAGNTAARGGRDFVAFADKSG